MYHGAQSINADPDFAGSFRFGPDAVLVAGSGLIIRLRKDIVGSNPTRPTKFIKRVKGFPGRF